jgi:multiple antibiotic resistance protein
MIAGGILLLVFSIGDLHAHGLAKPQQTDIDSLGIVPVGVPLITGPAVLTTSILLLNQYGLTATAAAVALNIVLAGVVLACSRHVYRILGKTGAKALSKLANIILAAIGVMMIRRGIFACLPQ